MKVLTAHLFEVLPFPIVFSNEECLRLEERGEGFVVWEPDIFAEFANLVVGLGLRWATAGMSYSNVRFEFEQTGKRPGQYHYHYPYRDRFHFQRKDLFDLLGL